MPFYSIINTDIHKIKGQFISVIGGGGKSSLIHTIGQELHKKGLKVILTSTTKLQKFDDIPLILKNGNDHFSAELKSHLDDHNIVLVADDYYKKEKLAGINKYFAFELKKYADVVLSEADGSRQRPLKTHKAYEPVIPSCTDTVVIICGAEIIGKELNDKNVHRADLFSEKWHLPLKTVLTPEIVTGELLSPESYLKYVPLKSVIAYYVNKWDLNEIGGKLLAEHLFKKCHHPIFLGSLKKNTLQKIPV